MHFVDILIIAVVGLILFGPKALQSLARNAGRGVGQAKDMKDKFMADLPMDEINKMRDLIPSIPLNSQQAVQMLLSTDRKAPEETEDFAEVEKPVKPSVEKKAEPVKEEKTETNSEAPKAEVKSEEVR